MNTMFRFLLAALATWRLTFLLAREDGPWHIFARLRNRLNTGFFSQLLGCVKCVGMWVSIPFAFFVRGDLLELVVTWLALAGVTALIDEWTRPPFDWQETQGDELLPTKSDHSND
jgi:hypothetical protein